VRRLSALRHVTVAWLSATTLCVPPAAAQPSPAARPLPILTRLESIRQLSQDESEKRYPVHVRGVVTHFDEIGATGLIVHDGKVGQYVMPPAGADVLAVWRSLKVGDDVAIAGHTIRGGFAPNIEPTGLRRLGRAPLPRGKQIPYSTLMTGRHDCDFIEIAGVVQRTFRSSDPNHHPMFADIAIDGGVVRASFWDYTEDDLTRLVDTRVRIHGNIGSIFGHTEQLRGVSLFGGRTRDVEILEAAPDPFSLPMRTLRSMYNYSPAGEVNRRIRVRGVVTAQISGRPFEMNDFTSTTNFRYNLFGVYVKDGTSGALVEMESAPTARPGDVVDIAGFPAVTPGKPILRNAVYRVVGTAAPPAPIDLPSANVITPENDAELIKVVGELLSVLTTPTERVLVLKMGDTVFDAGFSKAEGDGRLDRIPPGSTVAVTGVYSYQGGPPPSFRLFLRSPADIVVVASAPWWTMRHTAVMVVMFAVAGAVAGFWMRMLARRKRQEYQAVLSERNRVARELHDTLEQGLTGISLQLEAVNATINSSPDTARRSLEVARQMLSYSLEETRRSVMDLRSQALEARDLPGALTSLARQMTLGTAIAAEVRVHGQPQPLDASQEHHLLRIGLEALTNALKHANPSRIDIDLRFRQGETDLVVRDDGNGLAVSDQEMSDGHFGLQGVRERVDKLGGTLRIDSRPGRGTELAVTIPLRPRRESLGIPTEPTTDQRAKPRSAAASLPSVTR
jgi:signal transduction histidine kinase